MTKKELKGLISLVNVSPQFFDYKVVVAYFCMLEAKLIAKYERKLKRVRKEVFEQGEVVGFKKASEIKHYCESCGKLLKERR